MKNLLLLFIAVLFIAVSCGNKTQNNRQNDIAEVKTITLTQEEFLQKVFNYEVDSLEWKYLGDKPAIVDFYASWCSPCKLIAPTLESLAHEYDDRIYIYKIDTDKERALAAELNIESLPTLLFIPIDGEVTITRGLMTNTVIKRKIDSLLLK